MRQIKHGSTQEPNSYTFRHRDVILRESSRTDKDKSNTLNFAGTIKIMKYIKLIGTELQNGNIMVSKICDSEPLPVQFAAVCTVFCTQYVKAHKLLSTSL